MPRLFALCGLVATLAGGMPAAAAAHASQGGPAVLVSGVPDAAKAGMMLVDVFGRMCLNRFPDQEIIQGERAPIQELAPDAVQHYLHGDPGRAWRLQADGGTYIVTVETPPYNACAVRRTYPAPVQTSLGFQLMTQVWAFNKHLGPIQHAPPAHVERAGLTMDAQVLGTQATPGHPRQAFMDITTHNPDGSVESRLVRQIPPPGE